MGTITVKLQMPALDFVQINDVELRFTEEGRLRKLTQEEWAAYFPGCSYPKVYKRVRATSQNESVYWATITDRLLLMMNASGWHISGPAIGSDILSMLQNMVMFLQDRPNEIQRRFGVSAVESDTEPPTVWTLINFVLRLKNACVAFPQANVIVTTSEPSGSELLNNSFPGNQAAPTPVNAQLRAMTGNEIRRAFDRGQINAEEYCRQINLIYPRS